MAKLNIGLSCLECRGKLGVWDLGVLRCESCGERYASTKTGKYIVVAANSVFANNCLAENAESLVERRALKASPVARLIKRFIFPPSKRCVRARERFIEIMESGGAEKSQVLIVGGGTLGSGVSSLLSSPHISTTSVDVYDSIFVDLLADAHDLPFQNKQFDGVWVQAVLEHVIDPARVSSEITRVLKTKGILYSEIPFMQDVHEGAYDFTRFTLTGHRNLFRSFKVLASGSVDEGHTQISWALRSYIRTIPILSSLATVAFYGFAMLLRPLAIFQKKRRILDSASSTFLLCEKENVTVKDQDIIDFYQRQMHR